MAKARSSLLDPESLLARREWNPLPAISVLAGPAGFFKKEIIDRFTRELFGDTKAEVQRFQGPANDRQIGELPLATVLDDLRTPSFFSPKRLIIIDRGDAFLKAHRDVLVKFLSEGFAGGHLIVMNDSKLDGRTKFSKALAAEGWAVQCDPLYDRPPPWETRTPIWDSPLTHWIVRRAKSRNLKIEPPVAFTLHERVGTDLSALDKELEKLSTLLAEKGTSTVTEEYILVATGDLREDSIFSLVDLLLEGRRHEAIQSAERLFEKGYHSERGQVVRDAAGIVLPLIGAMTTRLRSLRRAHAISRAGGGPEEWMRERLVQKPFLDRFRRQLRATSPEQTNILFESLYELDYAAKSGGDTRRLLTLLLADSGSVLRA